MLLALRHSRLWVTLGWVFVALAVAASLMPGQTLPPTGVSDKFEHTLAYGLLTVWFTGIYPRSRYLVIAIALFAMGVAIEFAQQAMNLGRTADVRDVVANTLGIALGLAAALLGIGGWMQRVEAWTRR